MKTNLRTERIKLIKLEPSFAEAYFKLLNSSSEVSNRLTGNREGFTRASIEAYLEGIVSDSTRLDYLIVLAVSDKILGEIVLNEWDKVNRSASLRLAIFEDEEQNKGYGSEAIKLILEHGFGMCNLHRVELQVYDYNVRGIHVYEKLGFKREGVLRDYLYYNFDYHDAIVMSILRPEYLASINKV